jgi:hypothetical protein
VAHLIIFKKNYPNYPINLKNYSINLGLNLTNTLDNLVDLLIPAKNIFLRNGTNTFI